VDPQLLPGAQDGHRYLMGLDPACYSDRSGVVVLDVTTKPWRAVEVKDISGRDYLTQASSVPQLATVYNGAKVYIDATSHDQLKTDLERRHRLKVRGVRFDSTTKQELIDGLVVAVEHGDLQIPADERLIRELCYYEFQPLPSGRVKLGAPEGVGHFDDLTTALALAVSGARAKRESGILFVDLDNGGRPPPAARPSTFRERLRRHATPTGRPWTLLGYDE
jgi:hypothetical protein